MYIKTNTISMKIKGREKESAADVKEARAMDTKRKSPQNSREISTHSHASLIYESKNVRRERK